MKCPFCPRHCELSEGETGFCRARRNVGGRSVCVNYGKLTSAALDPIEKKPLARFCPGGMVFSVGSFGCNMDCPFCQNDAISMAGEGDVRTEYASPEKLAEIAEGLKRDGNVGAAFTYNEPMTGFEYVRDAAREVRARGMKNVLVTNGCFEQCALDEVLPWIDAYNIDLKGFTEGYYKKLGGDLTTVLGFIQTAAKSAHVELTTLVVPGENDAESEMKELAKWVAGVGRTIPLHVTRFFPRRKMLDRPPTARGLLYRLADVARESLDTVLVGNV